MEKSDRQFNGNSVTLARTRSRRGSRPGATGRCRRGYEETRSTDEPHPRPAEMIEAVQEDDTLEDENDGVLEVPEEEEEEGRKPRGGRRRGRSKLIPRSAR